MRVKKRKSINEINVVPYIDVMLVLLVIFMITAPLLNPGVINLPSIGKSSIPPKEPIEIIIRKSGKISLVDRNISNAEKIIKKNESIFYLKKKSDSGQAIVISADKKVRYEKVMQMMSLLQKNEIKRVGLMVVPKE